MGCWPRPAARLARPVDRLSAAGVEGAPVDSVSGKRVSGPLQGFGQLAYYGDDQVMLRIGYDAEANIARARAVRERDGRP